MTDIAVPDQQPTALASYGDSAMDRLGLWLQRADAVFAIAERICDTSFVPAAYRRKPDEAAAAMLAGAELGFDPMASLRAFDSINGTPAPKALTLRAVVLGAGHEIETVEQSPARAVVRGRRRGATEWQTSTWDIARAKKLPQFKTNPNYTNNPEAMLVARATSETCRWVAPDAVMGMPYSAEEIEDHPVLAPPVVRRLTAADLDDTPAATDEDRRAVFHRIEAGDDAVMKPGPELVGSDQKRHMFALWGELGYSDSEEDRVKRLWLTAQILGLDESPESSNDLTRAQADQVIAKLIERRDAKAGAADAQR